MRLPEASELNLITRISGKIKTDSSVVCGIGDDAAVLKYTKGRYLLYTCDMLIEGVDFTSRAHPHQIGHKALASSLSDIAAMGGVPRYALVSLGVPRRNAQRFIDGFYSGLNALARKFKVNVVGGDLSASEKIIVDVSVIGQVSKRNLTLRHGARPGDIIFVSGALGGSIYGKHLSFIPRIKEANYLVSHYKVSAMMDISDGLSLDLYRLCQASGVGAAIYEDLIPVARQAKSFDETLNMGEDFELLFTLPIIQARRLIKNRRDIFKAIGEIREKKFGLKLITRDYQEKPLVPKGYQHF